MSRLAPGCGHVVCSGVMMAGKHCAFIKPDGSRCGSWALGGTPFCYMHTGDNASAAGRKGGLLGGGGRGSLADAAGKKIKPDDPEDVVLHGLLEVISALRGQHNTPDVARALTTALSNLSTVLERRKKQAVDVTEIRVVYENDWRGVKEDTEDPASDAPHGSEDGDSELEEIELA